MGKKSSLIFVFVFLLFVFVQTRNFSVCTSRVPEDCLGLDVDTYVELVKHGKYEGWGGRPDIYLGDELPVAVLLMRVNPVRGIDEYLAFHTFMLAVSMLSGVCVYFIVKKLRPGSEIFAVSVWLFSPLNYRLFLDLAQNNLVNLLGLVLLTYVLWHEVFSWKDRMFHYFAFVLALVMLATHQFAFWWILLVAYVLVLGRERWQLSAFIVSLILVAGGLSQFNGWRYMLMLAFPITLVLTRTPKFMRVFLVVCSIVLYLLAPFIFSGHP